MGASDGDSVGREPPDVDAVVDAAGPSAFHGFAVGTTGIGWFLLQTATKADLAFALMARLAGDSLSTAAYS
ncbi:hypothetical protein [Streptomyces sp. NPDC059063]|uniref:hypothetical protein n=1 Tax=unclassified Streptomyces TaxID=2593676 RepID=UPI00367D45EA